MFHLGIYRPVDAPCSAHVAKGNSVYVDKNYNPGVSMWGDLHRTLEYSEGIYQEAIRERKESIRAWGGESALNK